MTTENSERPGEDTDAASAQAGRAEPTAEATGAQPSESASEGALEAPTVETLTEELEAVRAEMAQLRDAALRAQAEMENVRRRTQREVENAHRFALEKFAGELLPVADSLDKSVEAASGLDGDAAGGVREGIELSRRLFQDTLAKAGVEAVEPHGEPFDPDHHEAMTMVPNPDVEPNTVVDVLQKGYTLNGRLLRAAMVVVARGD